MEDTVKKLERAQATLEAAVTELAVLIEDLRKGSDEADTSNDAYEVLVAMLQQLGGDYDIAALCEDAQ